MIWLHLNMPILTCQVSVLTVYSMLVTFLHEGGDTLVSERERNYYKNMLFYYMIICLDGMGTTVLTPDFYIEAVIQSKK